MKLFGFEISKKMDKNAPESGGIEIDNTIKSFAIPSQNDGTMLLPAASAAGYYGQILDIDGTSFVNEKDLILKYRAAAGQPECDNAIADITNAAIISDSKGAPVKLDLDTVELPKKVKERIFEEFTSILQLLDFNFTGYDLFRRWYIDGKVYFHLQIDSKKPKEGIKGIIQIDPLKIKKIKEVSTTIDRTTGVKTNHITAEYFLYSEDFANSTTGVKIDPNAIVYVPSGVLDESGKVAISYLHKSIKLVNQLRMMEDALVIYRVSRAPERRIFYIDIGNLPKGKAEEYVQGIMAKYRNKLVYDVNTGEIRDDRKSMSMLEDFWLPRREGGRGTEITTLPGGQNLSEIQDIEFFQKKLYRSLNVPSARLENESMFGIGRSSEISREEVKFQKFVSRLRKKFSLMFSDILRVQCILKGIITLEDWPLIREAMGIDFVEDNFYSELKDFEILKGRLEVLDQISAQIGVYYSKKWVRSNVLNMSEHDVIRMKEEMDEEKAEEEPPPEDGGDGGFGNFGGDNADGGGDNTDAEDTGA